MSNTELKVIRAAIRSTRDLIQTLNDGREMPSQLAKIFFELNDYAIILSGMIEEERQWLKLLKICKHNTNGIGCCDILGGYCVEGPCSHEELAEYAPVVHGRWIEMEFLMPHPYYTCSVCGKDIYMEETGDPASDLFTYTYCPQCGAKMDERSINGEDEL